MTTGIVQIAIGERAKSEQRSSAASLRPYGLPVKVITQNVAGLDAVQSSRYHKTHLDQLTPFDRTLYLDADTRIVGDITKPFGVLDDGWDIALCPSTNQVVSEHLWHVSAEERDATYLQLGFVACQLQAGVIYFAKNERVECLFVAWRNEWQRWQGQDQAALLRALQQVPVKVWLLGRVYNGGSVIQHLFGRARSD